MGAACGNRDACALIRLAALLCAASLGGGASAQSTVALELVLAIDSSTSVDDSEFHLQKNGLANALLSPEVLHAVELNGARGVALMVMQWSGDSSQFVSVPWAVLTSAADVERFAARVRAADRLTYGFTDVAGALDFARREITGNPWVGERLVVDVSGDGTASNNRSAAARDRTVAEGITINGLVIFNIEYDLGELAEIDLVQHYTNEVIGGPGAFLMTAENFVDFEVSMRRKLAREITGALFAEAATQP